MATSISTGTLSNATSSALGTTHMNGMTNGLDIDALVNASIQAASLPMQLLQNKNTKLQAQLNDYNSLKTALNTLSYAANDLTYSSTFNARTTSTTNDKVSTASAKNGAAEGSYTININNLATTTYKTGTAIANMSSGKYATLTGSDISYYTNDDLNQALGKTGEININNVSISIAASDTINTIVNKISASGAGVKAEITGGKVVLTQKTVGDDKSITLGTDGAGVYAALGLNGTPTLTAGTDPDESAAFNLIDSANPLSGVTAGYFSINDTFISVDPTTDTLDNIINKINKSGANVVAFYDSTTKKLSLTSKTAGNQNIKLGIPVGASGATDSSNFLVKAGLLDSSGALAAGASQQAGADAQVTVNGVAVTPVNNKVTFNGVTFALAGTGSATVTVQTDTDSIVQKVQNFVQQYNTVIDLVNGKLSEKPDADSKDASVGDLFGDSTLRDISQSLRSFSYLTVASQPSTMQQLSQVGITTGAVGQSIAETETGHLSLDADKLRAAIQNDPDAVAKLFGNTIATVSKEKPTGTIDGSNTVFQLANKKLTGSPTVVVNGVTYTQVSGTPRADDLTSTPNKIYHEYSIDYATGKITFGTAPASGATMEVSYTYDASEDTKTAGIFVQMNNKLDAFTQTGGIISAITGSDGSITNQIKYNSDRIDDMNYRLEQQKAALYSMYQNMQNQLSLLSSQGNYLTALLSSLNSSSGSK